MQPGVWINGKRTLTGEWEYRWASNTFFVRLNKRDRDTGMEKKMLLRGGDSPEWGKWKLVRNEGSIGQMDETTALIKRDRQFDAVQSHMNTTTEEVLDRWEKTLDGMPTGLIYFFGDTPCGFSVEKRAMFRRNREETFVS